MTDALIAEARKLIALFHEWCDEISDEQHADWHTRASAWLEKTKPSEPMPSRWRCPKCRGGNVQISILGFYTETVDGDLTHVEVDEGADVFSWYCLDCEDSDSGMPIDANDEPTEETESHES